MTISGGYAQAGSYPAAVDRLIIGSSLAAGSATDLSRRVGVLLAGASLAVTAPGGMNVRVGVGQAVVPGGYVVENDAAYTLAVVAAGSSARTDLVIARMYDTEAGDGSTGPTIEIIKGTSTAVPATPARALALASIAVGASVSSIASGNLTDLRVFTAAAGGAVPVPGAIATPALCAGLPAGTPIWDSQAAQLGIYTGISVLVVGPNVGSPYLAVATRTTSQSISNATITDVGIDTTVENYGGFSIGAVTITVPVSGWYSIYARIVWTGNATGRRLLQVLYGSVTLCDMVMNLPTTNSFPMTASNEGFIPAGTAVRMQCLQESGGGLNLLGAKLSLRLADPRITS